MGDDKAQSGYGGRAVPRSRSVRWAALATLVVIAAGCGAGDPSDTGGGGNGNGNGGGGNRDEIGKPGPGKQLKQEFIVVNEGQTERTQTVLASVPFPEGGVKDLANLSIKEHWTSWRTLQKWADGLVKIGQAQFTATLKPDERRLFHLVKDSRAANKAFSAHAWTRKQEGKFGIVVEVIDDYGVSYYAIPDEGKLLHSSYHAQTRFWRLYLHSIDKSKGIKRDFLACRLYMTYYRDVPFVDLEIAIGSDYLGADDPKNSTDPNDYVLGPVHFKKLFLHTVNGKIRMRQRDKQGVAPVNRDVVNKRDTYTLLSDTWLDDGQTKYWNCVILMDDESAERAERDRWNANWLESADRPLRPLATLASWQSTDALGIHGGPVTGPKLSYDMAEQDFRSWDGRDHFGPFGTWGDAQNTHQTGTPRNAPVSPELAHAIQGENPRLLAAVEGKAWQQALRTFHLWDLEITAEMDIYFWFGLWFGITGKKKLSGETLGRFRIWGNDRRDDPYPAYRKDIPLEMNKRNHGFNPFDAEHATVDLLFDYFTISGSFWARDELEMMGEWMKGVMRFKEYNTQWPQSPRAEGWTMQAWVQCYLATGDERIKTYAMRRITEVIDRNQMKHRPERPLGFQWDSTGRPFPRTTGLFLPWQVAAVAYGYLGASRFFGSNVAMQLAEDAILTADYCSVKNFTDPVTKRFIKRDLRYQVPVVFNGTYQNKTYKKQEVPIEFFDNDPNIGAQLGGGTASFYLTAAFLLARHTKRESVRRMALELGDWLAGDYEADDRWRLWMKWGTCIPEEWLQKNRR